MDRLAFACCGKGSLLPDVQWLFAGPAVFKASLKTDEEGRVRFASDKKGRYTLRTSVEEKDTGEFEGKEFQLKRFHATVVLNLPVSQE